MFRQKTKTHRSVFPMSLCVFIHTSFSKMLFLPRRHIQNAPRQATPQAILTSILLISSFFFIFYLLLINLFSPSSFPFTVVLTWQRIYVNTILCVVNDLIGSQALPPPAWVLFRFPQWSHGQATGVLRLSSLYKIPGVCSVFAPFLPPSEPGHSLCVLWVLFGSSWYSSYIYVVFCSCGRRHLSAPPGKDEKNFMY